MSGKTHKKSWIGPLIGLYLLAVGVRFVLALLTRQTPTLNIDEFLYTGLARSIGTGEGLLFRGQTANYSYLTYPLFLSPVYALFPSGTNYFRILELWSILLMQSSVFPICALASELFGEKGKKPLLVSALLLLLPDFLFGEILLSECMIYPLFFAAAYFGYKFIQKPQIYSAICTGVLAGLLYETKPGQMALPLVLLLAVGILSAKKKAWKGVLFALSGVASGMAVVLLLGLLSGEAFTFSIYENQVFMTFEHMDRFFRGIALYPSCFMLICGLGCFLWPLMNRKRLSENAKVLLTVTLVSLGATIIGTSWSINRHEYASDTIHLRYIAMYVPLMAMFTLAPLAPEGVKKKQKDWLVPAIAFIWMAVSGVLYGLCCGYSESGACIGAMAGGLWRNPQSDSTLTVVITALSLAGAFAVGWLLVNRKKAAPRWSVGLLAALMLINNALDYSVLINDAGNDSLLSKEGEEALEIVGSDEYVYTGTDFLNIVYSKLAVNSRQNASYILMNDFFNSLYDNQGVYRPFKPDMEIRGTRMDRETIDTEWLLMDNCVYDLLKVNESVEHLSSNEPNARLHVLKLQSGVRWVDSVLGNVKNYVLKAGSPGIMILYDAEQQKIPLKVRLNVEASQEATLTLKSAAEMNALDLVPGEQWVEADFNESWDALNVLCTDCDLKIYGYELIPLS